MILSDDQRQEIDRSLARAQERFAAATAVAHRTGSLQGEYDNAFEGGVTGINFVVEAFLLASTGARRKVGEDEAAMLIRKVCADLRQLKIRSPDATDLIWEQGQRNTSSHQGGWVSNIGTEDLERVVELGQDLLRAVQVYLRRQAPEVSGPNK